MIACCCFSLCFFGCIVTRSPVSPENIRHSHHLERYIRCSVIFQDFGLFKAKIMRGRQRRWHSYLSTHRFCPGCVSWLVYASCSDGVMKGILTRILGSCCSVQFSCFHCYKIGYEIFNPLKTKVVAGWEVSRTGVVDVILFGFAFIILLSVNNMML